MKKPQILRSYKVYVLAVAIVLISLCAFMIFRLYQSSLNDRFCTTGDEIYQEIQINSQNWASYFFASASLPDSTRFEVQGRTYVVRADLTSEGTGIFYVSTAPSWPSTLQGLKGYIYTSSGQIPSNYWPPAYNTKHLIGNIYCYSEYEIQ